ncbi:MAG: hypothetical protein OHK0012_13170 [Synechococcales cyanobacterium]
MFHITCQPDNLTIEANSTQSLLEQLLQAGIPHAHACGGNAVCSTCRIMVLEGSEHCRLMSGAEKALAQRLDLPVHIRLACQTRITGDVTIQRLVIDSHDVDVAKQHLRAKTIGSQRPGAILSATLRGLNHFDEENFPYDIVYTVGRYYTQVGTLVAQHHGQLAGQNGLHTLAIFPLESPQLSMRQAVHAGFTLLAALRDLNKTLRQLSYPQVGLSLAIHYGPMIVMHTDPQHPQNRSVFGKVVQSVTWLESVTSEVRLPLLLSAQVAQVLQPELESVRVHTVSMAGRDQPVTVFSAQGITSAPLDSPPVIADSAGTGTTPTPWWMTLAEWWQAWQRF